jgi:hypothetical protein
MMKCLLESCSLSLLNEKPFISPIHRQAYQKPTDNLQYVFGLNVLEVLVVAAGDVNAGMSRCKFPTTTTEELKIQ